jgi:hypothetical protein
VLNDDAKHAVMRMLLPMCNLPVLRPRLEDMTKEDATEVLDELEEKFAPLEPEKVIHANTSDGCEIWHLPPKALWSVGRLNSHEANTIACNMAYMRQLGVEYIDRQAAFFRTQQSRLPPEKGRQSAHMELGLGSLNIFNRQILEGQWDAELLIALQPLPLDGSKPTDSHLKSVWCKTMEDEMVEYKEAEGPSDAMKRFESDSFFINVLKPVLTSLATEPAEEADPSQCGGGDDSVVDIGGGPAEDRVSEVVGPVVLGGDKVTCGLASFDMVATGSEHVREVPSACA